MLWKAASVIAALTAVASPAVGQTTLGEIPLEVMAYRADLIVVGRVLEAGQPEELEVTLPGEAKQAKGWFATYRVQVERVLKDAPAKAAGENGEEESPDEKPTTKPAAGATIVVLARSAAPRSKGVRLRGLWPIYPRLFARYPYVLILRRLPGRAECYLPYKGMHYFSAMRTEIARVAKAANFEEWPWGEGVDGLRIALVPTRSVATFQQQQILGGPSGGKEPMQRVGGALLEAVVALRNTSAKPVTVNLYKWDRFLSLRAVGADGTAIEHDFYKYERMDRQVAFEPKHKAAIGPGQVLVVGPAGARDRGLVVRMSLTPGRWSVRAGYSSEREAGAEAEEKLWTGKIESAAAAIEVRKAAGLAPGPGRPIRRR